MKASQSTGWFLRTIVTTLFVWTHMATYGQVGSLKGTWINASMQAVIIRDTTGGSYTNYLASGAEDHAYYLAQRADTLDFTRTYTSSADKFKQVHTDHLTFTFTRPNPHILTLVPVSKLAEEFFGSRQPIVVNRQESTVDATIRFEKLAFASGPCHGTCPTYEFAVDSLGQFRLRVLETYRNGLIDSAAQGYFAGQLPESLQRRLIDALQRCYLRQWIIEPVLCCDAPLQTLTVYFNGEQKAFNTEFPPIAVKKLIDVLHAIYATCPRQRVTTPFAIENPAKRIR